MIHAVVSHDVPFVHHSLYQIGAGLGVVHSDEERRKSWEKIFDYECTFDEERSTELSTQATMWEVKLEWVRKVEYFVVR